MSDGDGGASLHEVSDGFLDRFKAANLGRGYLEKFPGSRDMRDAARGVDIDVLLAGDYPGDGTEKPVRFPDPTGCALEGGACRLVPLETVESEHVAAVLDVVGGNRSHAADILGISRPRLRRLIQKYGLESDGNDDGES